MIFLLLLLFQGVDLVTEADTRVEKVITQMIKDAYPNDLIIGEEDQAESAAGKQDDLFPTGRIWCGELLHCVQLICSVYRYTLMKSYLMYIICTTILVSKQLQTTSIINKKWIQSMEQPILCTM